MGSALGIQPVIAARHRDDDSEKYRLADSDEEVRGAKRDERVKEVVGRLEVQLKVGEDHSSKDPDEIGEGRQQRTKQNEGQEAGDYQFLDGSVPKARMASTC